MAHPPTRILLRLDNGSLIGSAAVLRGGQDHTVIKLSLAEAVKAGRIGDADVERLERLVNKSESGRPSGNASKRPSTAAAGPPLKKARPAAAPAAPAAPPINPEKLAADLKVCQQLLQKMFKRLGKLKPTFYGPVKENEAPNYYVMIKEPMCLQQIETKLKRGHYQSAEAFCYDMRLVWSNCLQYNIPTHWIYKEGENMSKWFEKHWLESGLDPSQQPAIPTTAMLPPAKPEPSAAATSDYDGEDGDGHKLRRSRRPRVPNRRLSSPSNEGSGDDDDAGGPDNRATSRGPGWGEQRLAELQAQMEILQERDAEGFQDAVQSIVLSDPFYKDFDFSNEELTLSFDTLQASTLSKLDSDVQRRLYGKNPPPPAADADGPPASMHPSPHSTQTSMQQQPEPPAPAAQQPQQQPPPPLAAGATDSEHYPHKVGLMDALGAMDAEHYPQVLQLVKDGGVVTTDVEEFELDLEELSAAVCWKLDAFAREALGWKGGASGGDDLAVQAVPPQA